MSYGYGLGVYWEDYNDPEEPEDISNWWEIYQLLDSSGGTDKYYCSEQVEQDLIRLCKNETDESLRLCVGKFWNEKKRLPKVSVKNKVLQKRFDRILAER